MSKYLLVFVMAWLALGLPLSANRELADEPEPCVVAVWADIALDETAFSELMEEAGEGCLVLLGETGTDDSVILGLPAAGISWTLDADDPNRIIFAVWCESGISVGFDWPGSPIGNDFNEGTPVSYVFDGAFTLSADHQESINSTAFMEALRVLLLASDSLRVHTETDDGADAEAEFDIRAFSASLAEYPECST